jgi:hypothetical protein
VTCIAGLIHDGKVYMGGDSAGVAGYGLTVRSDVKVFKNGPFLMGFTTSFRMGDLLRYSFNPPKHHPDVEIRRYMVVDFVNAVRQCLKDGGYASNDKGEESGGTFLVGYKGRLFKIDGDYQVGESLDGYDAVGCGYQIASGSLFSTHNLDPRKRIEIALEAAERHSAGVRGPFHLEVLE